jgi:L-ascorbate metabolism protein UlaG (beta-lactamase superfamily)
MGTLLRWIRISVVVLLVASVTSSAALAWLWQTRAVATDIPLRVAGAADDGSGQLRVTWLGIATLLFDDGETQIITDATFSRYSVADILTLRPLESDIAQINYVLDEYRIDRLAAIVPLHSHFDHAIDAGHVANRTGAMILGSESTANIARGSKVPVDQYQTLNFGESRFFGDFTVTLLESRHVPQLPDGNHFFSGHINSELTQPARVNAWQSGATFSVLISHPAGNTLVKGSAGFIEGELQGKTADVAMISIAGLTGQGRDYTERYWQEIVRSASATRVLPIHFEDFTRPFGELALFPDLVDDVVSSSDWLRQLGEDEEVPVDVFLPPLGKPIVLY